MMQNAGKGFRNYSTPPQAHPRMRMREDALYTPSPTQREHEDAVGSP